MPDPLSSKRTSDPSLSDSETDAVWDLLLKSPQATPSADFTDRVMTTASSEREDKIVSFEKEKSLFTPMRGGVIAATFAIAATIAFMVSPSPEPYSDELDYIQISHMETSQEFTSDLKDELLLAAIDDPSLFSDEEVIALLN